MDTLDNPARRFHRLYSAFEKNGGKNNDRNPTTARDAWGAALGLDPNEELSELLSQFGIIVGMPRVIRERIDVLPDTEDRDLLARHLSKFEQVLSTHALHGKVQAYRRTVTAHQLESIESIAVALDRNGACEPALDEDALESLRTQVTDLFAKVQADESLPHALRTFTLRHLERLERAIRRVQIEGVAGLNDAVSVFVAEVAADQNAGQPRGVWDYLSSVDGKGAVLLSLVRQAAQFMALARRMPELATWIGHALPGPD